MRGWKRTLCAVLCIQTVFCLAGGHISGPRNVRASGLTNHLIKDKEQEIQSAKELKKELPTARYIVIDLEEYIDKERRVYD